MDASQRRGSLGALVLLFTLGLASGAAMVVGFFAVAASGVGRVTLAPTLCLVIDLVLGAAVLSYAWSRSGVRGGRAASMAATLLGLVVGYGAGFFIAMMFVLTNVH